MARTKENEAEWQKHHDELKFLWLEQRWTAERIRDYMSQKHGFHQNKYQYGRQFKQWGFKKNSSDERWKFIAHRREKRKRDGKDPGPVSLDGRLVPESKVRKETSRHVTLTSQYVGIGNSDPKTPEGVIVGTPPSGIITGAVSNDSSDVIAMDWLQAPSMDIPNPDASSLFQPAVGDSPAFQFELLGLNLPKIEANLMRDFSCCGVTLPSLHDLLQHYEEAHAQKSPQLGGQRLSHNDHRAAIGALFPRGEVPAATYFDLGHATLEHCVPGMPTSSDGNSHIQHISSSMSKEIAEEVRFSLQILHGWCNYDDYDCALLQQLRGLCVDRDSDLITALEPITIGGVNSDLTQKAQAIFQSSSPENLSHYLNLYIYLSSNNFMPLWATENLVSLIAKSRSQSRLRALLVSTTTKTEIFMSNLLAGAAAVGDVEICRILIEAGADLDAPSGLAIRTTPLHRALLFSKMECVRMLLKAGADPNLMMNGETPLHIACSTRSSLDAVRLLLQFGAHVDPSQGSAQLTPLQLAVQAAAGADIPLREGANVNALPAEIKGKTALQIAAAVSNTEGVRTLLDANAAVNVDSVLPERVRALGEVIQISDLATRHEIVNLPLRAGAYTETSQDREQYAPLHVAVRTSNLEITRQLLETGASPNVGFCALTKRTPLQQASSREGGERLVQLLINYGADVNGKPHRCGGRTALQAATEYGNKSVVKLLLTSGAQIKAERATEAGISAVEAAVRRCDLEILQLFLDKEPDIISSDPIAKSRVVMLALESWNCDVPFLELLLKAGAAVERIPPSPSERSVLQVAVEECKYNYRVVKFLLSAGATVNHRWETNSPLSVTALQAAVEKCNSSLDKENIDVVRLLLENGADINAPAAKNGGKTALQMAVSEGHLAMTRLLVHHGANVNGLPSPQQGRTALQEAASSGFVQLTEFLLAHGADVNAPAAHFGGVTALQGAAHRGNVRIVMRLIQAGVYVIEQGRNAIEGAAKNGRLDTLYLLLYYHPYTEEFETMKIRAAELALENGHLAIGRFLLAYRGRGDLPQFRCVSGRHMRRKDFSCSCS
ncbi:hypothetical protein DTO212C5_1515 [Paecilomyces variotii]|nr:hypothetical protein DTO212C5_1515 [Paecilomyces variotii]